MRTTEIESYVHAANIRVAAVSHVYWCCCCCCYCCYFFCVRVCLLFNLFVLKILIFQMYLNSLFQYYAFCFVEWMSEFNSEFQRTVNEWYSSSSSIVHTHTHFDRRFTARTEIRWNVEGSLVSQLKHFRADVVPFSTQTRSWFRRNSK